MACVHIHVYMHTHAHGGISLPYLCPLPNLQSKVMLGFALHLLHLPALDLDGSYSSEDLDRRHQEDSGKSPGEKVLASPQSTQRSVWHLCWVQGTSYHSEGEREDQPGRQQSEQVQNMEGGACVETLESFAATEHCRD